MLHHLEGSTQVSLDIWEFPLSDFLVLARPHLPALFILNPTACLIWNYAKEGDSVEDISLRLAERFSIDPKLAASDVERTLLNWREILYAAPDSPVPVERSPPAAPASFIADYRLSGKTVRIHFHSPELTEEIHPRLAHLRCAPLSSPDLSFHLATRDVGVSIFQGDDLIAQEREPAAARAFLLPELLRLSRGEGEWLALLHAGACSIGSRAIVFPASSHSGKTTLAAALMHSGFTLLGDDSVALIRDSFAVPALPFALAIREGSWPVLTDRFPQLCRAEVFWRSGQQVRFLPPSQLTEINPTPAQATALVFSRYERDAPAAQLKQIDTLQTLGLLQESGFWIAHDQSSIAAFLSWIHRLPSYTLTYSNLDEAVQIIRGLAAPP